MTGYASIDSAVEALKKGAYDYLRKPFEYEKLLKTIKNAIEYQRLKNNRKKSQEALRDKEEQYRSLVDQSLEGIVIVAGPPPKLVFANSSFAEIYVYTVSELLAMSSQELN